MLKQCFRNRWLQRVRNFELTSINYNLVDFFQQLIIMKQKEFVFFILFLHFLVRRLKLFTSICLFFVFLRTIYFFSDSCKDVWLYVFIFLLSHPKDVWRLIFTQSLFFRSLSFYDIKMSAAVLCNTLMKVFNT